MTSLQKYTADFRYLAEIVRSKTGFVDPVLFHAGDACDDLLKHARGGEPLPVDGVLLRTWVASYPQVDDNLALGMRMWELRGIRFAQISVDYQEHGRNDLEFLAVERRDYAALRKAAREAAAQPKAQSIPPVMPDGYEKLLWDNTIGFLEPANISRYQKFGLRAHRGVLLSGPPGNGKTTVCRWIWEECRNRGWERRTVTADEYRAARSQGEVKNVFRIFDRGVIFFDDMDLALRDRETVHETEDQSVFLTALDGIQVRSGVVFVFTTNCTLDLIDRAFKRPGRIDVALSFKLPDADLRRKLIRRWHEEIRGQIAEEQVVAATDGNSFAEIEELKNLLVMHYLNHGVWDWDRTFRQFHEGRNELAAERKKVGFHTIGGAAVRAR